MTPITTSGFCFVPRVVLINMGIVRVSKKSLLSSAYNIRPHSVISFRLGRNKGIECKTDLAMNTRE